MNKVPYFVSLPDKGFILIDCPNGEILEIAKYCELHNIKTSPLPYSKWVYAYFLEKDDNYFLRWVSNSDFCMNFSLNIYKKVSFAEFQAFEPDAPLQVGEVLYQKRNNKSVFKQDDNWDFLKVVRLTPKRAIIEPMFETFKKIEIQVKNNALISTYSNDIWFESIGGNGNFRRLTPEIEDLKEKADLLEKAKNWFSSHKFTNEEYLEIYKILN